MIVVDLGTSKSWILGRSRFSFRSWADQPLKRTTNEKKLRMLILGCSPWLREEEASIPGTVSRERKGEIGRLFYARLYT